MRKCLAIFFLLPSILFADEGLPDKFNGQLFNCRLTSKIFGDGFATLEFGGLNFGSFIGTCMTVKNSSGEQISCREEPLQNVVGFLEQGGSGKCLDFTTTRLIKDKNHNIYAEAKRRFHFSPKGIDIQVTFTAHRDFVLAGSRRLSDLMIIPTKTLIGAIVTVMTRPTPGDEAQTFNTLIPDVYSKESWGMKGDFMSISLHKNDQIMTISAGENSSVAINHYGGVDIEIGFRPNLATRFLRYQKGSTVTWSSELEFSKKNN